MTVPGVPTHKHISEREPDGSWEDCTWDSGLEFYRDAIDPSVPATHAEAQKLRAASGEPPTGGSNLGNLRKGVAVRYKHSLPPAIPSRDIVAHLAPNWCAVLQGSMKAFGPNHRLSVFDRNFDAGHAVWVANVGGRYYWCDPEAPTNANVPVVVTAAELTAFAKAFPGSEAIVAPILSLIPVKPPEADMPTLTSYIPGWTANIKPESNVRNAPVIAKTSFVRTSGKAKEPIVLTGTVKGDTDPGNGSDVWYMWYEHGVPAYTAKDNILDAKSPSAADDGYTAATQAKAVTDATASLQATIDQQADIIANQKTALIEGASLKARSDAAIDALKG